MTHSATVGFRRLAFMLAGVLASCPTTRAGAVYANDFQSNSAGFNSSSRVDLPTTGDPDGPSSKFLGEFAKNQAVTLTLNNLTAGQSYAVQFDLFLGKTWDGSYGASAGPDVFKLTTGDGQILVDASFGYATTKINGVEPDRQSYSDATPVNPGTSANPYPARFAGRTGADVNYFAPAGDIFDNYSIYYFGHGAGNPVLIFTATDTVATLTFAGRGLQTATDEFWAIGNVRVGSVPEPSAIAMAAFGMLAAGAFAHRRRRA